MELLSRIEEIILLTVYELEEDAYGIKIKERIEELVNKKYSIGAIYVPLERLYDKGLLKYSTSKPSPERGGRRKKVFKISSSGMKALLEIKKHQEKIWEGIAITF